MHWLHAVYWVCRRQINRVEAANGVLEKRNKNVTSKGVTRAWPVVLDNEQQSALKKLNDKMNEMRALNANATTSKLDLENAQAEYREQVKWLIRLELHVRADDPLAQFFALWVRIQD